MPAAQKLLFPDPKPLPERLGNGFFRVLPERPAVYLMHDETDVVLYVGKAKNLKKRLCSYRVANPERMARRTLRLLRLVTRIAWEECETEAAALRRESELLLALKPRFNRAGVWEGEKRFLAWRIAAEGLELAAIEKENEHDEWKILGHFGAKARYVHRALVRLLWCRAHRETGIPGMPSGWFYGEHGSHVIIPHTNAGRLQEAEEGLLSLTNGGAEAFSNWLLPVSSWSEQETRDEDLKCILKSFPNNYFPNTLPARELHGIGK